MKYGYGNINTTLPDNITLSLRRAYYAAVSFTDSLVRAYGFIVKVQYFCHRFPKQIETPYI